MSEHAISLARHVAECADGIARYYEAGNTGLPSLATVDGFDRAVAALKQQLEREDESA